MELTVCKTVLVNASAMELDTLVSTAVALETSSMVVDSALLPGTICVVLVSVVEEAVPNPMYAGYESIPKRTRAHAIPNPAVAIGLSGNLKCFSLYAFLTY
jgi:hypothetical protein